MMNSFHGGGGVGQQSNRYHELQNLIKGVPIQCMVGVTFLNILHLGPHETTSGVPKRRFKNQRK